MKTDIQVPPPDRAAGRRDVLRLVHAPGLSTGAKLLWCDFWFREFEVCDRAEEADGCVPWPDRAASVDPEDGWFLTDPSVRELAEGLGATRKTVRRWMRELEAARALYVVRRPGSRTSIYYPRLPPALEEAAQTDRARREEPAEESTPPPHLKLLA